ncbi:MAG: antitoxin [Candidatus Omnitrophota bacterium]
MRRIKLTKDEQWVENHMEEFIPVGKKEYEAIARAIEAKRKDAVLNIRVNSYDLNTLKQKARKLGIKYQTFISEILHKVAQA